MADYLTPDQITARLQTAGTNPSSLCTFGTCPNATPGDSANGIAGRNPPYVKISAASSPVQPRIGVVIIGGLHAREWAPPDALVSFIETMLATNGTQSVSYPFWVQHDPATGDPLPPGGPIYYPGFIVDDRTVRSIFANIDLYIAPLMNPDGRAFSRIPNPTNLWWRKNRRTGSPACIDGHGLDQGVGVDINRNFDIAWDIQKLYEFTFLVDIRTLTTACPGTTPQAHEAGDSYAGPSAMSEAETKNVAWLQQQGARVFVDVHSAGPDIIYPWGIAKQTQNTDPKQNIRNQGLDGTRNRTYAEYIPQLTDQRLFILGGRMQSKVRDTQAIDARASAELNQKPQARRFSAEYQVGPSAAALYLTSGVAPDYHFSQQFQLAADYTETATPPELLAYTIECGSQAQGFFWPDYANEFPKIEREVHAALWGMLSYVASPQFGIASIWPFASP